MFQFPPSPTPNQTFTPVAGVTYRWSGTAWHLIAGPGAFITQADADVRYVQIDAVQNVTNRIINGKFAIDQRRAGGVMVVAVANAGYALDRWSANATSTGTYNLLRSADAAFPGEYRLLMGVVTADTNTANAYYFNQSLEGYTVADLCLGTANASPFTYAFEVECSIAGTFPVSFRSATAPITSYVTTFTIAAPNVRQQVVIPVPACTINAAAWGRTNDIGLQVFHTLGPFTASQAPSANTWLTGNFLSLAGTTNWMTTVGTNMYIKNVRLYKGSVDFGPDRRLYAEELALCQRYYEKSYPVDVVPGTLQRDGTSVFNQTFGASTPGQYSSDVRCRVEKRTLPTVTVYNPDVANNQIRQLWVNQDFSGTLVAFRSTTAFTLSATTPATGAAGQVCGFHWTASAEL